MSGRRILVWQWGRRGAGPRFAAELAAGLKHAGHEPVLSLSTNAESFEPLSSLCARNYHVTAGRTLAGQAGFTLTLPARLARLAAFLEREDVAGAVCAMPGYWDGFVAARLRAAGIPLVTIVHDWRAHAGDRHELVYRLQRGVVRNSKAAVTLSGHVEGQIRSASPALASSLDIVRLSHPPFSFRDLRVPDPAPPRRADGPVRVLVAGRIKAYKGVETALAMMEALSDLPLTLRIAGACGDAPWRERAEAMENVSLRAEWLSEREMIEEIDAADIALFPYVASTQSGLVPVCQSRGRPVIVSPAGGLAEQVASGRDGIVAGASTHEALALEVRRLAADPARRAALGAAARRDHAPEQGWRRLAADVAGLFEV